MSAESHTLEVQSSQQNHFAKTIKQQEQTIESLTQRNQSLSKRIELLEEMLRLQKVKRFAPSSEKDAPIQTSLFDEDDETVEVESSEERETITYTRKKPERNKPLDTSCLPREKKYIDLSDEEKRCQCGCAMTQFGEESREELVYQPAIMKVIEHIRPKYSCKRCETVKSAAAIEMPIPKSKAGAELLACILLNKYHYHLPFYRQSKAFDTLHQIKIPDNTLGGWAMQALEQLMPLSDALWQALNDVKYVQADETPVKLLKPDKKAYMWLYHSLTPDKQFVIFDFSLSRSSAIVDARLQGFSGLLQTDGYSGYNGQRARNDVITLGCWDHARRKFMDVVKAAGNNKSGKAGQMIKKIAKLYEIERDIKTQRPNIRKEVRQQQVKPILDSIQTFINKINAPPSSLLGKAVTYCKNQWQELIRYVEHGDAQISNCLVENQVRPFAVGKKNWMFIGNEQSAQRAALAYSLIQSCLINNINPYHYLVYVLKQANKLRRKEINPITLLPHTIDKLLLG